MLAHLVQTGFGGFYDGIAHWVLTPRDLLVVITFALFGGLGGVRVARAVVVALPAAWLVAGWIGFRLPEIGDLTWATTVTIGLGGLLVALDWIPRPTLAATLAVIGGAIHGLANGSVMTVEGRAPITLYGVATAVALATLLGAAGVASMKKPTARIAVRVGGSWLAAAALLMIGWLLKPV